MNYIHLCSKVWGQ